MQYQTSLKSKNIMDKKFIFVVSSDKSFCNQNDLIINLFIQYLENFVFLSNI